MIYFYETLEPNVVKLSVYEIEAVVFDTVEGPGSLSSVYNRITNFFNNNEPWYKGVRGFIHLKDLDLIKEAIKNGKSSFPKYSILQLKHTGGISVHDHLKYRDTIKSFKLGKPQSASSIEKLKGKKSFTREDFKELKEYTGAFKFTEGEFPLKTEGNIKNTIFIHKTKNGFVVNREVSDTPLNLAAFQLENFEINHPEDLKKFISFIKH